MNLGDVLHGLGNAPLKDHIWTDSILKTLNAIIPNSTPLTPESSGMDALNDLNVLDEESRNRLLQSEVDPLNGTLTLTETTGDVSQSELDLVNKRHHAIIRAMMKDPQKTMMTAVSAAITIGVIGMVFIMMHFYMRDGTAPNTSLFEAFFHALIDIYNLVSSSK